MKFDILKEDQSDLSFKLTKQEGELTMNKKELTNLREINTTLREENLKI